jgi:hypothetical protein
LSSALLFKRDTKSHREFWIGFSIVHCECTTDGTVITDLKFRYLGRKKFGHTDWWLTKSLIEVVAARNSHQMTSTAVFSVERVDESGKFCLISFILSKRHDVKIDLIKFINNS